VGLLEGCLVECVLVAEKSSRVFGNNRIKGPYFEKVDGCVCPSSWSRCSAK